MLRIKEFSMVAGLAYMMAVPAFSATTIFSSSGGSGFFAYQDTIYNDMRPVVLPQFDPAIAKGSFLNYVLIEFNAFAESAGGSECDSEGNSEILDGHVAVSLLGSTYSKGGIVELDCSGPGDAIDYSFSEGIYRLIELDSSKYDLSLFIGTGIVPISIDYGGSVTDSIFTYEIYYGFEPSLSTVPLPATGGLLMASLFGLVAARRKYRNRAILTQ